MGLDAAGLKRWSDEVAQAPLDYRSGVEAALDHRPAVRRWVTEQVKGLRISVQGVALYFAGIVLFAHEQEVGEIPALGARRLAGALARIAGGVAGANHNGLGIALLAGEPAASPKHEVVAALFERETPPGFLPLHEGERAALALLLCALIDALAPTAEQ